MPVLGWKRLMWWIGGLTVLAVLTTPDLIAGEHAISARVQEAFEVNGERFDAGRVSLREVSDFTPAITLNEIWINGRCLGLMLADVSTTAGLTGEDRVIFERNAAGTLVLVGFAYRDEPARSLYSYTASTRWSSPAQRTSLGVALASR